MTSPQRRALVIKPIFTYPKPQRGHMTSWRNWGGIETDADVRDEEARVGDAGFLGLLASGLDEAVRSGVDLRGLLLQPGQEGGTEIKTDPGEVIDNINDTFICIENPGCRIRCIAFSGDPFVPVMIRVCRILYLDFLKPGILAWRLIKVAMYTDKTTHVPFLFIRIPQI